MIFILAFSLVAQAAEHASPPLPTEPRLQICPLDLAEIRSITPLGNLNPRGGHVFPTDHIYLTYGRREGLPVRAPTSGRVFAMRGQIRDDFKIEVQVNDRFSYYIAHVLPVKGLSVGSTVDSGEIIAHTSGRSMLDLGCVDTHVTLKGLVNPDRYPEPTLHCVSPLRLDALALLATGERSGASRRAAWAGPFLAPPAKRSSHRLGIMRYTAVVPGWAASPQQGDFDESNLHRNDRVCADCGRVVGCC